MRIDLEQALDDIAGGATRVAEPVPVDRVLTRMHRRRAVRTAGSSVVGVAAAGALAVGVANGGLPSALRGDGARTAPAGGGPAGATVVDVDDPTPLDVQEQYLAQEAAQARAALLALEDGPVGEPARCGSPAPEVSTWPVSVGLAYLQDPGADGAVSVLALPAGMHARVDQETFYAVQGGVVVGQGSTDPALAVGTVSGANVPHPQAGPPLELCGPDGQPTGQPLPPGTYEVHASHTGVFLGPAAAPVDGEPVDPGADPVELGTFVAHSAPVTLTVD